MRFWGYILDVGVVTLPYEDIVVLMVKIERIDV